jgi:enoyl-CoA hydratase/carnithine racemase
MGDVPCLLSDRYCHRGRNFTPLELTPLLGIGGLRSCLSATYEVIYGYQTIQGESGHAILLSSRATTRTSSWRITTSPAMLPPWRPCRGLDPWNDVLARLSRALVLTIASIRGRAPGAGSEFLLACDVRFASREKAILGQWEVGAGAVPGGGPMARLSRLVRRGHALEILIGADDFAGDVAERYGYVNRALPDAELDTFVETFARRMAGFEKEPIQVTKRFVDGVPLPPTGELAPNMNAFFASAARPETQSRAIALFKAGLQTRADVELRLGDYVALHSDDSVPQELAQPDRERREKPIP